MPDLEKVIHGLECCAHIGNCLICPYLSDHDSPVTQRCDLSLMIDALALLKGQEPMIPIKVRVNTLEEFDGIYKCRSCGQYILLRGQKYCYECGREVKWND